MRKFTGFVWALWRSVRLQGTCFCSFSSHAPYSWRSHREPAYSIRVAFLVHNQVPLYCGYWAQGHCDDVEFERL